MATSRERAQTARIKAGLLEALEHLPPQLFAESKDVKNALREWISYAGPAPDRRLGYWVYLLQDSPGTDLYISSLTHTDLTRYFCLESLQAQYRFNVYLAEVEKREVGTRYEPVFDAYDEGEEGEEGSQHDEETVEITEWTVRLVFDINDVREPQCLGLDPDSILQGDIFEDREPDEEDDSPDDYDEPAHPDMHLFSRYYRSLALVVVPKVTTAVYLLDHSRNRAGDPVGDLLGYFSLKCMDRGGDIECFVGLVELCERLFSRPTGVTSRRVEFCEDVIAKVLEAAIFFQNTWLFELVCSNIRVELSPGFFFWIAERMEGLGLPFTALSSALDRSIFARKTLADWYRYIVDLDAFSDEAPSELRGLTLKMVDRMVGLCYNSILYEEDGKTLVYIACYCRDYNWVLYRLAPLVFNRIESTAFVLGFAWELYMSATQRKLRASDSLGFMKVPMKALVQRLDVDHLISEEEFVRRQQRRATGEHQISPPPPPVTSLTLSKLFLILFYEGIEDDLRAFAKRLTEHAERIDAQELADLFVPFVYYLMDSPDRWSISMEDPIFSELIRTILKSSWARYVMREPGDGQRMFETRRRLAEFDQDMLWRILGSDYCRLTGREQPSPTPTRRGPPLRPTGPLPLSLTRDLRPYSHHNGESAHVPGPKRERDEGDESADGQPAKKRERVMRFTNLL